MKRLSLLLLLSFAMLNTQAFAQWSLGASFELRNEDPQSGFGLQLHRSVFKKIPVLTTDLRLHASYFSEENRVETFEENLSRDFVSIDYGVDLLAGINVGLVKPYAGLGLGAETFDFEAVGRRTIGGDGSQEVDENIQETNFFWNITAGAQLTSIPVIRPFIEYRYVSTELSQPDVAVSQNERILFGVLLSF